MNLGLFALVALVTIIAIVVIFIFWKVYKIKFLMEDCAEDVMDANKLMADDHEKMYVAVNQISARLMEFKLDRTEISNLFRLQTNAIERVVSGQSETNGAMQDLKRAIVELTRVAEEQRDMLEAIFDIITKDPSEEQPDAIEIVDEGPVIPYELTIRTPNDDPFYDPFGED